MVKTWMITGSARGIGLEIVRLLLLNPDYAVIAACRSVSSGLEKLFSENPSRLRIVTGLDVTDPAGVESAGAQLAKIPLKVDVLINNAGWMTSEYDLDTSLRVTPEIIRKTFEINVLGPMLVTQLVFPKFTSDSPVIVNVSTKMGSIELNTSGGNAMYRISKAALNQATKNLSAEVGAKATVIAIHPGWVQTDMGGPTADLTPTESASGQIRVIESLKPTDSGKFYDWKGDILPW